MSGAQVFRQLQSIARADVGRGAGSATQSYVTRHALESFLGRLAHTRHARDFVLKGGLLLGADGARRPTKDVDSNAMCADVSAAHLRHVMNDVAAVEADDGVSFDVYAMGRVRWSVQHRPGWR